jgi:hypothetical protein
VGVIELDFVLDEDQHKRGFNVTVNGPQAARLFDAGAGSAGSVGESGEMYQAMEVHCGVVKPESNCHLMDPDQVSTGRGGGGDRITYCDDDRYVRSDSLFEQLRSSHPFFAEHGLVSYTCMYNSNRTEIYNVTGYNYTCLPPCTPTLWSYQIEAPGCHYNCSQIEARGQKAVDAGLVCLNTPGLFPIEIEFACVGGDNNGYVCAGAGDISGCAEGVPRGFCLNRDRQWAVEWAISQVRHHTAITMNGAIFGRTATLNCRYFTHVYCCCGF